MFDQIKPLLDNGIINEDTGRAITEAWESKLNEAREQVRAELREEFARKYEHDKTVMVEALDRMVTDGLSSEIEEFRQERKSLNEDRVKAKIKLQESAGKFNQFMVTKLAEEIRELRSDRKLQMEQREKLESFVVHALAREIREFHEDKRAVIETKVRLVAEARDTLESLKQKFVTESASRLKESVAKHLKHEITQLKEDIKIAREQQFGRRLFEAFAAEFSSTHLNEKAETRKLLSQLAERDEQINESKQVIAQARKLVESKEREVKIIREQNLREKTMSELLGTLNEEKAQVMKSLLESVQTPKLKNAFDKYLPSVLTHGQQTNEAKSARKMIAESVEVTGDKTAVVRDTDGEDRDNVIAIKRLAGL